MRAVGCRSPRCVLRPSRSWRSNHDISPMNLNDAKDGLVRFTNCLVPTETGTLVAKDVWVDQGSGVVLDAQVRRVFYLPCYST